MTRQSLFLRWCRLERICDQLEELMADCDDQDILVSLGADWHAAADQAGSLAPRIWPNHPDQWHKREIPQMLQRS